MDKTRRHRRPSSAAGFFKGWDFKSWGEAIAALAVMLVTCAAVIILIVWLFMASDANTYAYEDTTTYWVEQGDTLWRIAREYSTNKQDVRRVIDIIEQLNDCSSVIYPGQCLTVPVFYK